MLLKPIALSDCLKVLLLPLALWIRLERSVARFVIILHGEKRFSNNIDYNAAELGFEPLLEEPKTAVWRPYGFIIDPPRQFVLKEQVVILGQNLLFMFVIETLGNQESGTVPLEISQSNPRSFLI